MNMSSKKCFVFTLLELLIVVGVMGVLIGISIPSFSLLQEASQAEEAVRNIGNNLSEARNYAISSRTGTKLKIYNGREYLLLFDKLTGEGKEWFDLESGKPEVDAVKRVLPGTVIFKTVGSTVFAPTGRASGKNKYEFLSATGELGEVLPRSVVISKVSGRIKYVENSQVSDSDGEGK